LGCINRDRRLHIHHVDNSDGVFVEAHELTHPGPASRGLLKIRGQTDTSGSSGDTTTAPGATGAKAGKGRYRPAHHPRRGRRHRRSHGHHGNPGGGRYHHQGRWRQRWWRQGPQEVTVVDYTRVPAFRPAPVRPAWVKGSGTKNIHHPGRVLGKCL
jgi:hypothetical protein